jgi:hypothetical protein
MYYIHIEPLNDTPFLYWSNDNNGQLRNEYFVTLLSLNLIERVV